MLYDCVTMKAIISATDKHLCLRTAQTQEATLIQKSKLVAAFKSKKISVFHKSSKKSNI